jgi:hypothetical protein
MILAAVSAQAVLVSGSCRLSAATALSDSMTPTAMPREHATSIPSFVRLTR